mgnify:CR=1 FL=1
MPRPGPRTTYKYTDEFKATAVKLSYLPGAQVRDVAHALYIHPFMLSRWRKEYLMGNIVSDNKRPSKPEVPLKLSDNEHVAQLQKRVQQLEMENDLLKKWQRFAARENRKNSSS